MEILVKIEILVKKWKFWSKKGIFIQKWKFWSKKKILVKNENFG